MNFIEFEPTVRKRLKELPYREHVTHMGLGVVGEFGELCDAIKKYNIYGKGVDPADMKTPMKVQDGGVLDKVNILEEVGDATWYVAGYLRELELTPSVMDIAFKAGFHDDFCDELSDGEFMLVLTCIVANAAVQLMAPPNSDNAKPGTAAAVGASMAMAGAVGTLCRRFNLDISAVLERNDAKLEARYQDKFNEDKALHRDLEAERAVLEGNNKIHGVAGDLTGAGASITVGGQQYSDTGGYPPANLERAARLFDAVQAPYGPGQEDPGAV